MLEKTQYVLSVDSCPQWPQYKRAATLAMCPGNENWEGEKFITALEWVARHFDFIRVDLSDTLNRHNLMSCGVSESAALRQCKIDGDEWVAAHGQHLAACGKPFEIIRWNRWRLMPEAQSIVNDLTAALNRDIEFAEAFNADIETYKKRLLSRGHQLAGDFEKHCHAYLLEELACISLQARTLTSASRLYPAKEPRSSKLLRSGQVLNAPKGLEREYYIAFNLRRRSLKSAASAQQVLIARSRC